MSRNNRRTRNRKTSNHFIRYEKNYTYVKEELSETADTSLFIKELINNKFKKLLITTPPKFGKTTKLELIKTIFELPITEDGLIGESLQFNKNLKIFQDEEFLEKNNGTYLVLFVNFERITGTSFEETINQFQSYLGYLFKNYSFLLQSPKLDTTEISQFANYCFNYENLTKAEIIKSVSFLTLCLCKHFEDMKLLLLIDNYDSPITSVMFNREFDGIRDLYELFRQMVSFTLDSPGIERAVLMGVHSLDVFEPCVDKMLGKYPFLGCHEFVKYHGLSESELNQTLNKLTVRPEILSQYKENHKCYTNLDSINFYQIHSVLGYFEDLANERSYDLSRLSYKLPNLSIFIVRYSLEKLRLNQVLVTRILNKFNLKQVTELEQIFSKYLSFEMTQLKRPDLFLSYLLNEGYLTLNQNIRNKRFKVKLQHNRFAKLFQQQLVNYYQTEYEVEEQEDTLTANYINTNLEECAAIFNRISSKFRVQFYKDFALKFHKLSKVLRFRFENVFHSLMFDVLCKSKFGIVRNELTFTDGKPDLLFYKNHFGIVANVTYEQNPKTALKRLVSRYEDYFTDNFDLRFIYEVVYLVVNLNENKSVIDFSVLVNSTDVRQARCLKVIVKEGGVEPEPITKPVYESGFEKWVRKLKEENCRNLGY